MKARIEEDKVLLGSEGYALYEQSGFGRPQKDGLRLSPVEALYLVYRGRIEVPGYDFDTLLVRFSEDAHMIRSFLVYRDIRERGYVVQTGPHDFRVFKRGEKPGKGESQYMVRVLSERDLIDFSVVQGEVRTTLNMRKQHVLAVVDDEFEITYYEVKLQKLPGLEVTPGPKPAQGILSSISVIINAGADLGYDQAFYGKRLDESRIVLATVEAAYLMEQGLVNIFHSGEKMTHEQYCTLIQNSDPELDKKITVYRYLRELQYIPKTGYKFGHHFRVYSGRKIHSEMLVQATGLGETLPMNSISRSVRMAHSVKKKMLFAGIHDEGIVFTEFARIKL
ncbi:tRNA-intron lyase [Methanospirillum sp.]|uniref:tRNA-intron lyase n=1 Tax=Methanospirillum sp. TaxID=45200 RepID=UPI0029853D27|nr:tRNA-intron lyase [Methanospirillum sp.]